MAVALDGTVLAASATEDRLLTLRQQGDTGFLEATTQDLPGDAVSDAIALTAVGAVPVVLDSASGRLLVVGGAEAEVPPGSVLQQPGPSASAVLVGARDALLSVDLATGKVTTVTGEVAGDPAAPVRLGDCVYGAWSGGTGAVVTACGGDRGRTPGPRLHDQRPRLPHQPRSDRPQRPRDRPRLGRRLRQADPSRQLGRLQPRVRGRGGGRRRRPAEPGRPPAAEGQEGQPRGAARPHHDPAPARQRHRSLRPAAGHPDGALQPTAPGRSSRSARTARPSRSPCRATPRGAPASSTSSTTDASPCPPTAPSA